MTITTGNQLRRFRKALRPKPREISQAHLARLLSEFGVKTSQTTLSRLEQTNGPLPVDVQKGVERMSLVASYLKDPEKIVEAAEETAAAKALHVGGVQYGVGTVVGAFLSCLPKQVRRGIQVSIAPPEIQFKMDDEDARQSAKTAKAGDSPVIVLHHTMCDYMERHEWGRAYQLGLLALSTAEGDERALENLQPFVRKIKHNLGVVLGQFGDFEQAEAMLQSVVAASEGDPRDLGLALQQLGMLHIKLKLQRGNCSPEELESNAVKAEQLIAKAGRHLGPHTGPATAWLYLSDWYESIGQRKKSESLADRSADAFAEIEDKASGVDFLHGAEAVRRHFPNLSRRKGFLRSRFGWLFGLILMVASLTFHEVGNRAMEHEVGNRATVAQLLTMHEVGNRITVHEVGNKIDRPGN